MTRNIGIIGDGPTDLQIFGEITKCVLEDAAQHGNSFTNIIELKRNSIRDSLDRYWNEASKENTYYLPGKPAVVFQGQVTNVLYGAFRDFESELGIGNLSNQDILLVTTDAERSLSSSDAYFEPWAFSLSKLIFGAIEPFYRAKAREGYSYSYLPLVLPLVTFPSTEIFIAIAKGLIHEHCGKKARELKLLIYGTDNLNTLHSGALEEKALHVITRETLELIFKRLPESRIFLQTLSLSRVH
jgi:hypothetical protein